MSHIEFFNLYYDNDNGNITNQILDNELLFVSSYSKYTKRGSIKLKKNK